MQKIGLIDVDYTKVPNLALMKISAYHKRKGDTVEFSGIGNYDKTYISKVFSYSDDPPPSLSNLGEVIKGGYAYNKSKLATEIEHIYPDYSLYNEYNAYGFLTRGCIHNCSWCVVPKKEGKIRANADITEFWNGQKAAILLDNNVLAHDHGLKQIEKMTKLGIKVDFNQGLDARIIAKDTKIAKLLSGVKWLDKIRISCDTRQMIPTIDKALKNLNKYGVNNNKILVYVMFKEIDDALERLYFLRKKGCVPYAQPFRDFENYQEPPKEHKQLARWVNSRKMFFTVDFADYNPAKG